MNEKTDKRKFWLSACMIASGVVLLFLGMLIAPAGIISASVIGGAGEIFLTAGAILGIDVIYAKKLTEIVKDITDKESKK